MLTTTTLTDNKCPNCKRKLYYYIDGGDLLFDKMGPDITKIVCPFCMSRWGIKSITRQASYEVIAVPMVQRGEKITETLDIDTESAHDNAQKILDDYSKEVRCVRFKIYENRIMADNFLSSYTSFARKYSDYENDETIGMAVAFLRSRCDWTEEAITKAIFG